MNIEESKEKGGTKIDDVHDDRNCRRCFGRDSQENQTSCRRCVKRVPPLRQGVGTS